VDKRVIDTVCAGAYAGIERIFDDTPSDAARFEPSGAVPSRKRNIHLRTQRQPHRARRIAGGHGLCGCTVTHAGEHEVGDEVCASRTELVPNGAVELAPPHSAEREFGRRHRDQVVRDDVREDRESLEDGQTVRHLAHDGRDGDVERLCDGREDLARRFLLTAFHLAEVTERDTGATGDLTEGATLLLSKVAEDFTDLVTNQDHVEHPPPTVSAVPGTDNGTTMRAANLIPTAVDRVGMTVTTR
jgi:hypothetical protein